MLGDVDFIMLGGRQTVCEYAKEKGGDQHSSDKCEHTNRSHEHLLETGSISTSRAMSSALTAEVFHYRKRGISPGTRSLTLIYAPANGSSLPLLLGPRFEPRVEEAGCDQAVIINMGFTWLDF